MGYSVKQHFFNINSFIEDSYLNRLLDSNDRFLIDRVLKSEPHSYKYLTKFSELAKYTNSEEIDVSP